MHPIKRAAEVIGSQREMAKILGVTPGAVTQWLTAGVPADRCPSIERMTRGAVTCEELRPDIDWGYLRGTRCDDKAAA